MTDPVPDDVIEVKCWSVSFKALKSGDKRFEFRKDDRPYAVGKTVHQREWNPDTEYTGDSLYHDITWIIHGGVFGIPEGYCIYSASEPRSTRARGPVAQQAPAVPLIEYVVKKCQFSSIHTRKLAINDIGEGDDGFSRLFDLPPIMEGDVICVYRGNYPLAEHDAALITQERKKWEREQAQLIDEQHHRVGKKLIEGICDPNGDCAQCILCDNAGGCLADGSKQVQIAAAQAREDVLKAFEDHISSKQTISSGVTEHKCWLWSDGLNELIASLRSEVKK